MAFAEDGMERQDMLMLEGNAMAIARERGERQDLLMLEGPFQVRHKAEADLKTDYPNCDKDHTSFIPVDRFSVYDLPLECQDSDLVDLTKTLSDLTLRLTVNRVSKERPDTYPDSNVPYPFHEDRGKDIPRVGTGWVSGVYTFPTEWVTGYTACQCEKCLTLNSQEPAPKCCECQECLKSDSPKSQFAHIIINTAAHVIYDNEEAESTRCDFFFDNGRTPEDSGNVVTVTGLTCAWCVPAKDKCDMRLVTHDLGLAARLGEKVKHLDSLKSSLDVKYKDLEKKVTGHTAEEEKESSEVLRRLTIIVSHPHGCSKHVSIGRYTDKDRRVDRRTSYAYTAATCPGCSGAVVTVIGRGWGYRHDALLHSGCLNEGNIGFSGPAIDS